MSLYAVSREAGPSWVDGMGAFDQPAVDDHAAFMNALADEGLVLFAGPVAGSEQARIRLLLVAEAESEADIRRRLADDPWERTRQVVTTSIEPWTLIIGENRLGAHPVAQ